MNIIRFMVLTKEQEEVVRRLWEKHKPKHMNFLQVYKLYEIFLDRCNIYGIDPQTIDFDAIVDWSLTYEENKDLLDRNLLAFKPAEEFYNREWEELEYWKKKAEELEKKLEEVEKSGIFKEKEREYIEEINRLKKKIEMKEREIEELSKRKLPKEVEERIDEFAEMIRNVSNSELWESYQILKENPPPELSKEEILLRIRKIETELNRRKWPRSKITGEFLEPVYRIEGYPLPPGARIFYDPIEERFYRDGRPITTETIRRMFKPVITPRVRAPAISERYEIERREMLKMAKEALFPKEYEKYCVKCGRLFRIPMDIIERAEKLAKRMHTHLPQYFYTLCPECLKERWGYTQEQWVKAYEEFWRKWGK